MEQENRGGIDLHIHSMFSDDGQLTPTELVKKCYENNIKIMAIADHNTIKANKSAREEAQKYGIQYLSAIEIDCVFKGVSFHLLGYGIMEDSPDFLVLEKNMRSQNILASKKRQKLIKKMGFDLTYEELCAAVSADADSKEIWTGELFAEILLTKKEYLEDERLKPYRTGGNRSDNPYVNFYWDYCSQDKLCDVKMNLMEMAQAITIIHNNCGKAVLAHPGNNLKNHPEMLDELVALGLDGIEALSSYHNEERALYYYEEAIRHHLMVTAGSDFHGKTKPSVFLGGYPTILEESILKQYLKESGLL